MAEKERLSIEIVTPERRVYSGTADFIVLPGSEGELGILPGHAPLLSKLTTGELRMKHQSSTEYCLISEGFVEVRSNHIAVAAESAEMATDIDVKAAELAKEEALKNLEHAKDKSSRNRADAELKKAILRISIASKGSSENAKQKN
jgi:F-type H+-transporting ATPase subunit epsilon